MLTGCIVFFVAYLGCHAVFARTQRVILIVILNENEQLLHN